jgi:uncharacterized secreted protein with C-terminal beta-propeller domain
MNDNEARDVLGGADAPRPLPDDLRDELTRLLSGPDPVTRLATSGSASEPASDLAPLPVDLRERLTASLMADAMPAGLRRRLARALPGRTPIEARILSVAAVATAVLLLAGGLAFAGRLGDAPGPRVQVAAPTSTTTTTDLPIVESPLVTEPAPPTTAAAPPTTTKKPTPPKAGPTLAAFKSCDDLLAQTKTAALQMVGPYGMPSATLFGNGGSATAASGAEGSAAAATSAGSFSETNVQEQGVDEPDLIKTDGRRIVTITQDNTLRVSVHDDSGLRVVGSLELPRDGRANDVFLAGNRVVLFGAADSPAADGSGQGSSGKRAPARTVSTPSYRQWSVVWVVDIADAEAMRVVSSLYLEGRYTTARLVDGHVRLVVSSAAVAPTFVYPADGSAAASDAALRRNREIVASSTADDWSPRYLRVTDSDRSTGQWGRLCACDRTLHPDTYSGTGAVSVVTIDPANPQPDDGASVHGAVPVVYASAKNLYVTSTKVSAAGAPEPLAPSTAIHRFDITNLQRARYVGSASARGFPINQFSMSEFAGHLRIATTDRTITPGRKGGTESFVTAFALRDAGLEKVGELRGLGDPGDTIQAVRFIGPLGFVVTTVRLRDPLYVIDLADPTKPRARGELKVPGYSAYLHPIDDGFLLGIGRDADEQERDTGSQVSSYDVRNPEQPTQVDRLNLGAGSSSAVERDHRAFLYWPATRTAVLPLYRSERGDDGVYRTHYEAAVVTVGPDQLLTKVGGLTHEGREHRFVSFDIRREIVIGGTLYTLSDSGLLASDIHTLADIAWRPF